MKFLKYIFFLLLIFTSCKTKKIVGNSNLSNYSPNKIVKKHLKQNLDKETITAKLKLKYKDENENLGISVQMKIKKDEVIYLKGSKLITLFKAKITPKKVSYYNYYLKDYFEGDFSMIKKVLGTDINFQQLQNLLLGQALQIESTKQKVVFGKESYELSPKNQSEKFNILFFVNPKHFKLDKQLITAKEKKQKLTISYPKYLTQDNELFPNQINITAEQKNKLKHINILVKSLVFNKELNMPFKIPSGYKEIKL